MLHTDTINIDIDTLAKLNNIVNTRMLKLATHLDFTVVLSMNGISNSLSAKSNGYLRIVGRPTSIELQVRKMEVVEVATRMFFKFGYAETSLSDIARSSRVSTRMIYKYLGDKEDLFRVVIENLTKDLAKNSPKYENDKSLSDTLFDTAIYIRRMAFSENSIIFHRLIFGSGHILFDYAKDSFESLYSRLHATVVEIFDSAMIAEVIPQGNSEEAAKYFIDLLLGSLPMRLGANCTASAFSEAEIQGKITLFIVGRFGLSITDQKSDRIGAL